MISGFESAMVVLLRKIVTNPRTQHDSLPDLKLEINLDSSAWEKHSEWLGTSGDLEQDGTHGQRDSTEIWVTSLLVNPGLQQRRDRFWHSAGISTFRLTNRNADLRCGARFLPNDWMRYVFELLWREDIASATILHCPSQTVWPIV
jgi:hypothetical protein